MTERLAWQPDLGHDLKAETEKGTYRAGTTPYGSFGSSFRPIQGDSLVPKNNQPLGRSETLEQAKAKCEQHYLEHGGDA